MGNYNSGRRSEIKCTEDCLSIDIRRWQRDNLLRVGLDFNRTWSCRGEVTATINVKIELNQVRLSYSYQKKGSEWEKLGYSVKLQTTPCRYGGVRYWFICPAMGCGRRVALLYLGNKIFACRHCYQLAYRSQRKPLCDRKASRADKLRDTLKWEAGILNGKGCKPKGMHWKTYYRLVAAHDEHVNKSMAALFML